MVLWILALAQTSFLPHFGIVGRGVHLILIFVFFFVFFENPQKKLGIFVGLAGGLMLNVLSGLPFGVFSFTFVFLVWLIKKMSSAFYRASPISFFALFVFSFFFYALSSFCFTFVLSLLLKRELVFLLNFQLWPALLSLFANLIIAAAVFFLVKFKLKFIKC